MTTVPDAGENRNDYDPNGRLASVTDPRGLTTRSTNNFLDLPEQISSPDTRTPKNI